MSPEYYDSEHKDFRENAAEQGTQYQTTGYHRPGAAITSMVLGICSVSLWFYPFITSIPCIIMGFVALGLAKKENGMTDPRYNGMLKAGKITGTIGAIVSILYTIIFAIIIATAVNK